MLTSIRKTVKLHRAQHRFRHSSALYRGFVGGRGSGKSWIACYDLIRRARPDRTYLLASPTYRMLLDSEVRTFASIARELGALRELKLSPPASARLYNGAEILLRSADDPEHLRGPNLSGAVLMEAALMHRDAYDITIACLRENGEQGWLAAATTPRGPQHWTHEVFATGRPHTELYRARTADNPFNPAGFEVRLKQQYGDTLFARQELDGEFVALEGAEFPAEWFARQSPSGGEFWFDRWPQHIACAVASLDPSNGTDGKGKDYQAHVEIAVVIEGGRYVYYVDAALEREGVIPMCARRVQRCRRFAAETGRVIDSVFCEENGTLGLLAPALDAAVLSLQYPIPYLLRTNRDPKEFRIRAYCAPPLSRYQLRFRRTPGARVLVGQLQSWPHDEFDDGPDALASGLRRVTELLT
jgi:phage terminase large subunit-like protein